MQLPPHGTGHDIRIEAGARWLSHDFKRIEWQTEWREPSRNLTNRKFRKNDSKCLAEKRELSICFKDECIMCDGTKAARIREGEN
jgi:hypothetical protein